MQKCVRFQMSTYAILSVNHAPHVKIVLILSNMAGHDGHIAFCFYGQFLIIEMCYVVLISCDFSCKYQ